MPRFVALLRGINVGGNNKVDMKVLLTICQKLGWKKVRTYINSGNVVFESEEIDCKTLATALEDAVLAEFGFIVRVLVFSAGCIQNIAMQVPANIQNNSDMKTDVLFLWDHYDNEDSIALIAHNPAVDTLMYFSGAIVWSVLRKDYSNSGMNTFVKSVVYRHMTARNINTVRKLSALVS
jgi:uncharacterized protein (DUF1697 family)